MSAATSLALRRRQSRIEKLSANSRGAITLRTSRGPDGQPAAGRRDVLPAWSGGFTYWPDGPLAAPQRLVPPLWNRGVVTQNTAMYHRGESNGPAEQRANPKGLTFDSTFAGDPGDADLWEIRTGDAAIARYRTDQLRLLVHWDAELYADLDDLKKHVDHRDDLAPDRVFETFVTDLRAKGVTFEMPSDPMHDPTFIALLARTYDVGPSSYPAEAPVAAHAA